MQLECKASVPATLCPLVRFLCLPQDTCSAPVCHRSKCTAQLARQISRPISTGAATTEQAAVAEQAMSLSALSSRTEQAEAKVAQAVQVCCSVLGRTEDDQVVLHASAADIDMPAVLSALEHGQSCTQAVDLDQLREQFRQLEAKASAADLWDSQDKSAEHAAGDERLEGRHRGGRGLPGPAGGRADRHGAGATGGVLAPHIPTSEERHEGWLVFGQ